VSDGAAELRALSANLGRIAGSAVEDVDAVIQRAALNVKREMQADASRSASFKGMAGSISYDSHYRAGRVRYVVGPDKGRRGGALGNIAYFGTSRGGGSLDINRPLRTEEPRMLSALEALSRRWAGQL
jgi:hypothetical protein